MLRHINLYTWSVLSLLHLSSSQPRPVNGCSHYLPFHFPKKALLTLPRRPDPKLMKLFWGPEEKSSFEWLCNRKDWNHFFVAKDEWLKTKIPEHLWWDLVCQRIQQRHSNKWVDTTETYSWCKSKHWRAPTEVGTFSHFVASFQRFQLLSRLFLFNSTM